jgi:hypothetical protein
MTTARDIAGKLIALRAWLSEARQELERELDHETAPLGPAEEAIRQWHCMAIGQLKLLRDMAGSVLSTVDVAYDISYRYYSWSGCPLPEDGRRGQEVDGNGK